MKFGKQLSTYCFLFSQFNFSELCGSKAKKSNKVGAHIQILFLCDNIQKIAHSPGTWSVSYKAEHQSFERTEGLK
jgi:hypothetical protein